MSEKLVSFMLQQMEHLHDATFWRFALEAVDKPGIGRALENGLIGRVQEPLNDGAAIYCPTPISGGCSRRLSGHAEGFRAHCECEAKEGAIEMTQRDLERLRPSIDRILAKIMKANKLAGTSEFFASRIWRLGNDELSMKRLVWYFALVSEHREAESLFQRRDLAGNSARAIVILTPDYQPPAKLEKSFAGSSIYVHALGQKPFKPVGRSQFEISMQDRISLSKAQRLEAERYGLSITTVFEIPGQVVGKGKQTVLANGYRADLTDTPFRTLLRLIGALSETGDGWLSWHHLDRDVSTGSGGGSYQRLKRLREPFKQILPNPGEFIQGDRLEAVRFAVHPELISINHEALLELEDRRISELLKRIPKRISE